VADYVTAMQLYDTGALLKVHPSNFRVEGFTEEAGIGELAGLAAETGVPLIFDIGSGHLDETGPWLADGDRAWLADEPAARQALAAGAGLVTFSGDKLIGGPQAGIIAGDEELVASVRSHPLARAMRLDAGRDAALAATLEAFLDGDVSGIPLWSMARIGADDLRDRVDALREKVGGEIVDGVSLIGAGSVPGRGIASPHLWLSGAASAHRDLLGGSPPVVTRRHEGGLLADLRTVPPGDDPLLAELIGRCL
jgi:L-seryl-tRNA(Ser) seleniumtransferase